MHVITCVLSSLRCKQPSVHSTLVLHEQARIAATRLVWTAVILNIAARLVDQFQTIWNLKGGVKQCIQNPLEAKRGFRVNPLNPRPPLCLWAWSTNPGLSTCILFAASFHCMNCTIKMPCCSGIGLWFVG